MEQQKDVCVRCCEPLELAEARFNRAYWGMAHRQCTSDAMWPPRFRPSLDPTEVMRQIAALCAHLAKISTGLTSGLPIPQILHRGPSSRAAVDRSSVLETSNSEEKHGQRELGVDSRRTSSDNAQAMEAQATPGRKRTQRPKSSPQATPSPKAKEARQGERTGDAQASEQHPVSMPPPPSPNKNTVPETTPVSMPPPPPPPNKNTVPETTPKTPSKARGARRGGKQPTPLDQQPTNQPTNQPTKRI